MTGSFGIVIFFLFQWLCTVTLLYQEFIEFYVGSIPGHLSHLEEQHYHHCMGVKSLKHLGKKAKHFKAVCHVLIKVKEFQNFSGHQLHSYSMLYSWSAG